MPILWISYNLKKKHFYATFADRGPKPSLFADMSTINFFLRIPKGVKLRCQGPGGHGGDFSKVGRVGGCRDYG